MNYIILSRIVSYHIVLHRIESYHIISYHIISYHIISYHIISYHTIEYVKVRLHDTTGCPTGCTIEQPVAKPVWQPVECLSPFTRYNRFDNRLYRVYKDSAFRLYRVNGVLATIQETRLSQRDRATLCVSWNLVNSCTTVQEIALEKLANMWMTCVAWLVSGKTRPSLPGRSSPAPSLSTFSPVLSGLLFSRLYIRI